jgi:hypothetical protein
LCQPLKLVFDTCLKLSCHPSIIVVGGRVQEIALKLEFAQRIIDTVEASESFESLFKAVESKRDLVSLAD